MSRKIILASILVLFGVVAGLYQPKVAKVIAASSAAITVDPSKTLLISKFNVGVTHTQYTVGSSSSNEDVSGRQLLNQGVGYANVHIHGWGVGPIFPDPNQPKNWSTLDKRVDLMRSTGNTMVISLCCGQTWMVDPNWSSGTDWTKLEDAILPPEQTPGFDREQDFANLAKEVALRYPDVKYFQVWNEMKGLWNSSANNWDYSRYTRLYNKVWDAIKAVRPDAMIGGPYLKIEGSGGNQDLGLSLNTYTKSPLTDRNRQVIEYWMANKRGADFITIDRNSIDGDENFALYPELSRIKLTHWFGDVVNQIKALPGYKGEPIWWAEDYIWKNADTYQPSEAYQSAALASMLGSELKSGSTLSLRWGPMQSSSLNKENLITDTRVAGGGKPLPAYFVYKNFHDFFGPGATIVNASSSTADVEVIASNKKTMLINKTNAATPVTINGSALSDLTPYEVRLIDTPITSTSSILPSPTFAIGDANKDGFVNEADFDIWKCQYLSMSGCTTSADFNLDSKTDGVDYVLWLTNYRP